MSTVASREAAHEKRRSASTCGSSRDARSIGPATSCGKKQTKVAKSSKFRRAASVPRYLDRVAQLLERVERDTDGQHDRQRRPWDVEAKRRQERMNVPG